MRFLSRGLGSGSCLLVIGLYVIIYEVLRIYTEMFMYIGNTTVMFNFMYRYI